MRTMKNFNPFIFFLLSLLIFMPGCDLIEGIFEAGFWFAIILIVVIIALIVWALFKLSTQNRKNPG